MCQFSSKSTEQMESNDNNNLIGNTGEEHVKSSQLHPVIHKQGAVQKNVLNTLEVDAPSPSVSLMSCESFASNCSEDSVYANSSDDGVSREDSGGSESGQEDPRYRLYRTHVKPQDAKENDNLGKNGWDSPSMENDDSTSSDESYKEEDAPPLTFYERDEIWDPPEAENVNDDIENNMTILDDEDDEDAAVDSSEWAMPRSKEKQLVREKVKNGRFKELVSQLLRKVGVENCDKGYENWVDIVVDLAWEAAKYVKPGATDGDIMDPSGYVKIKCIAAGSRRESRLIKGLVFKKHAAHKHMITDHKNPKLLLISGMLDPPSGSSGLSSFNSMITEDKLGCDDHDHDLIQNLQASQPNVILVEKSASRAVMEKILHMGVTLVLDMKINRLERVARCTGAPIVSSDAIANQKLRHCDSLYFEKIVEEHSIVGDGGKKPSKTLMFLEGCPTRLGCTILLKGSHGAELKRIKCVVQCAVVMAYHLLLETSYLVDQNAMFSTIAFGKTTDASSIDEQSTSAISESSTISCSEVPNVQDSSENGVQVVSISDDGNRDSSYVPEFTAQEIPVSHGLQPEESSPAMALEANGSSTICCEPHMTSLSAASSSFSQVMEKVSVVSPATYDNMSTYIDLNGRKTEAQTEICTPVSTSEDSIENDGKKSISSDGDTKEPAGDGESKDSEDGESEGPADDGEESISAKDEVSSVLDSESILILMSIRNALKGTICEQSHFSHIKFYRNFDVPLGKFLRDNLLNQALKCQACSQLPDAHIYYYAHHSKQLTIRVKQLKKPLPRESEGKIWMWSRCSKCEPDKNKATKRVLISTAARGLSFGKFLELSFSSQSYFNRLASCGHSFQKDFLCFFGLGSMASMFQYSHVAIYNVSVPSHMLKFNNSIQREWLEREIRTVYTSGVLLFNELEKYLTKLEAQFSGLNIVLNGISKRFADILDMLRLERSEFEVKFKNNNEDTNESPYEVLSLNRLRWEILLEACVWDRRLQSLLSTSSTLPQTNVTGPTEVVERILGFKEDSSSGEETELRERQRPLEEHGIQGENEVTQKIVDEAKQDQEGLPVNSCDGSILEDKQGTLHGDNQICGNCNDMDLLFEMDLGEKLSIKKSLNEGISTLPSFEETKLQPTSRDSVPSVSLSCESNGSTDLPSHLHCNGKTQQDDVSLSGHFLERTISIKADEEEKQFSPLLKLDSQWWVPFEQTREECLEDLVKGRPSKFGFLPKFELLHSPDFLPTVSHVIIEEGSRLHIPLRDGNFIVSDFDGELSSSVSCALAFTDEVIAHLTSDSDENTSIKRAASEPWPLSNSLDSDVMHSASSMSFTESHLSTFGGSNLMDSQVSFGCVQNEVTLGIEKYPMKGKYSVVILCPNEFRSLRDRCCPSELDYIASLNRCKIWDAKGGKSKSVFAKTLDDRLIIKEIKKTEFDSFMKFAAHYFDYIKKAIDTGNQTCLAKILGIYQVTIRNPKSGKETKHDLMVQENLSFGRNITRQYDLKGALYHRFTTSADDSGDVLLDQNFVNDMNLYPLYVGQKAKRLLQRAIWNDTTFLKEIGVMDYSLLVGVDRQHHELVCGIIDYLRQYTWDKQVETWVKSSLVPKNSKPTIISPQDYKTRFRKFMDTHFLTVPDHWCSHRSSNPCNLCADKTQDSVIKPLEKLEEEPRPYD